MSRHVEAVTPLHEQGWALVAGLLSRERTERLAEVFRQELLGVTDPLRRQLTSRDEVHRRDDWGRVRNPMVVHHLPAERHPAIAHALRDLLTDPDVLAVLHAAIGAPALTQATWVHSTDGTALHTDPHPLEPGARLIGVWLALEDIRPHAGPFVVVPGSLQLDPTAADVQHWRALAARAAHDQFHARTDPRGQAGLTASDALQQVLDRRGLTAVPLLPRAGDVILWRGDLVHGSHPPAPGVQTRQSLLLHIIEQRFARPND